MVTKIRLFTLIAGVSLSLGASVALANNGKGLGKPPFASLDTTLGVSPTTVGEGSGVALTFTLMLGASPASITNGAVEVEAPEGWTFTAASIGTSTCNTTDAVAEFTPSEAEVSGLTCSASGQTLVLNVTATTPDVLVDTPYGFEGSIKSSPGSRRLLHNVFLIAPTNEPTVTVTAV